MNLAQDMYSLCLSTCVLRASTVYMTGGEFPKKGLQAILESNAPVGVFAKHKDHLDSLYIVK